jgi:hypothetical protein
MPDSSTAVAVPANALVADVPPMSAESILVPDSSTAVAAPTNALVADVPPASTLSSLPADSSTVPALAVDALLAASAASAAEAPVREAVQLDLLGEPLVDQQRAVS